MERIVLEVKPETARRWRMKSRKVKQAAIPNIDRLLNIWLDSQEEELWPFLERLRRDAEYKGFNDDILANILNEP
ncbi:MAG: hypothetical protein Q4G63_09740 [Bacteroidia bacterium]|nr:hypothetical protein [Bacteroidia bacterium]